MLDKFSTMLSVSERKIEFMFKGQINELPNNEEAKGLAGDDQQIDKMFAIKSEITP